MKTYLKLLLATMLTICGCQPALGAAVIFSGNDVKALKSNLDLNGQSKILSGSVDPTSSATSAPVGSIYLNSTNGNVYRKLDSGSSTNWDLVGSGTAGINNLLVNPTWNAVSTSWTASGGTYARTTTAAQIASGAGAGSWDSGSASQTLTSSAVAIPAGAYGLNGVASCKFKAASGTATHKIQAYDGTNVLAENTITSDTSLYPRTSVNFPFPSSGNIQLRIISVASDEPALYIDDCYLGLAEGFNTAQVSQATLWAKASWASATNCEWSTTSASLANFSADTDCNNPTVVGYGSAAGTKIPGFTISSLPTGNYQILVTAVFAARDGSTNNFAAFRVTDGTNNSNACTHGHDATTQINANGCSFSYRNTSPLSNVTLQIQGLAGGSGGTPTAKISGSAATLTPYVLEISVYRFPDTSETAISIDQSGWFIDANINGGNIDLGTSNQTSYIVGNNSSLTLTNNPGAAAAQITCSSTNPPTGTTCSSGSEESGISFTIPRAGQYLACTSFAHYIANSTGGAAGAAFQIIETPINAQTISQEGKSRVFSAFNTASSSNSSALRVCGTFNFSSAGQKALRLAYEQSITATVSSNLIVADASSSTGQRDIHWEVYPVTAASPAPLLVGSVTSNSLGLERVERARIGGATNDTTVCSSSPCTVHRQSGSWLTSVTRGGPGSYTLNIATGIFSGAPTCTFNPANNVSLFATSAGTTTATSVGFTSAVSSTGSVTDTYFDVICMGPR